MDNKTKAIFKINNILLSAYKGAEGLETELFNENDYFTKNDKTIDIKEKKTYQSIKEGTSLSVPQTSPATLTKARAYMTQNKAALAFGELAQLLKNDNNNIDLIKDICSNLLGLKGYNIIIEYFREKLLPYLDSDRTALNILASAFFSSQEHYEDAIPLFEKLTQFSPEDSEVWFKLAFSYERVYQDKFLDKQLEYINNALKHSKNKPNLLSFKARILYRLGDKIESEKTLKMMLRNNPSAEDIVVYSRFLMKEGRLTEGYDIYRKRFETGIVAYPKLLLPEKRWDGKSDISDSTIIVHYEQGFGDSVMFSRYIPEISKLAKKVIFVVQKNLVPLFKSSGFEKYCDILSHEADINPNIVLEDTNRSVMYSNGEGMGKIDHDYHIPIMDLPYLFKTSPDNMILVDGYLKADEQKIKDFKKKYIKNNEKIKIGLSYHGTKESILTYRDISIKRFLPLFKLKGVEFYSFQSDKYAEELMELDKSINITDLGRNFKNFEDTACAMNCMDLIISTDNVVMNLGGALGIKTYALFNKYTESRWYKTTGENIGWYNSVKPFQAKTFNDWDNVILEVKQSIKNDFGIAD